MEYTVEKRKLEELTNRELYGLLLELANSGDDSAHENIEKDIFAVLRQREETAWEEQQISQEELNALMEQYSVLREKMLRS